MTDRSESDEIIEKCMMFSYEEIPPSTSRSKQQWQPVSEPVFRTKGWAEGLIENQRLELKVTIEPRQ
jgi:hypothetical protein